ncbi:MAG: hypothetical protein ACI9BD_000296 [Candidatus Marinamargulisbacteria bacterium]|jgi:hypothetical protein
MTPEKVEIEDSAIEEGEFLSPRLAVNQRLDKPSRDEDIILEAYAHRNGQDARTKAIAQLNDKNISIEIAVDASQINPDHYIMTTGDEVTGEIIREIQGIAKEVIVELL